MEIIRFGSQYRQDPHLWGNDLSPGGAKENEDCLKLEKVVSLWDAGLGSLSQKSVFRQSRWAAFLSTTLFIAIIPS